MSQGSGSSRSKFRWALFLGVAAVVLSLDQVSKHLVLSRLPVGGAWNPIPVLQPFFTITHVTNTGAAFGLFQDWGTLFAIIAVLVVIGMVVFYRYLPPDAMRLRVSLGLQLGGALGNLVDRVRLGTVVDFIDFKFWPVFNLADTAIVCGVSILAIYLLFSGQEGREKAEGGD